MAYLDTLKTKFSTLKTSYEGLLKEEETRDLTADEQKAKDTQFGEMTAIQKKIKDRVEFAAIAIAGGTDTIEPKDPEGKEEFAQSNKGEIIVKDRKIDRVEFNKSLNNWFLTGQMDRQFATITTATQSGVLLPTAVANPESNTTLNVFREALALYGRTPISTADTGKLNIPVMDGASGGVVSETAGTGTERPPTFAESVILTPQTYESGTAWLSGLALGANGFDLLSYIEQELEFNKELGLENAIVDALIADSGITQSVNCASGVPTYANMVSLNRALPKRFDRVKVMVLDGTVISALEALTGSDGHPVLTIDPQNQGLLRFNGTPVLRADRFADYAGTDTSVMGVVMSLLAFKLRDAGQKQVLRYQESTKVNQTGINLCTYHAFGWSVSGVAKLLA